TYPVLMAADILLHGAEEVPVGEDQRQHVELARDVASRFNARYGPTFTVPRAVNPPVAARIMDLAAPDAKMSKSAPSAAGALRLLDDPTVLRRKVLRAVTDARADVTYDPQHRPGVSNLLAILAACTGGDPVQLTAGFDRNGELKQAVADAVVETIAPLRERYLDLARDPEHVRSVLRTGAHRARELARQRVQEAKNAIGLLAA
ncbi:MAG: tryptophan--tRNA ligase, partial [Actinomycetes bacterium]